MYEWTVYIGSAVITQICISPVMLHGEWCHLCVNPVFICEASSRFDFSVECWTTPAERWQKMLEGENWLKLTASETAGEKNKIQCPKIKSWSLFIKSTSKEKEWKGESVNRQRWDRERRAGLWFRGSDSHHATPRWSPLCPCCGRLSLICTQ